MAKTKTKSPSSRNSDVLHGTNRPLAKPRSQKTIPTLLAEAATYLTQSQPELALPLATSAVTRLQAGEDNPDVSLPAAMCLLAEIQLELGEPDAARGSYQRAVELDPQRELGAEVWFSLAQLSEVGGAESVRLYETGAEILRKALSEVPTMTEGEDEDEEVTEAKSRLADALCAMAEVYMTDLSWENDAEARCEAYITEAVAVCPGSAAVLQTLASVRISQERVDEARGALRASMECWDGPSGRVTVQANEEGDEEEVDDEDIPEFPTRISLTRLLMEVQLEFEALVVLDRLVREDDESVEAWYLSGWGRVLLAGKEGAGVEEKEKLKEEARMCLATALRLYRKLDYEDEPLRIHAVELVGELGGEEGEWDDDEEEEEDDDENEEVEDGDDSVILEDDGQDHDGDVDMT